MTIHEYETNENEIKILVPGCGLGRLTYELACEGNELSNFMLIASMSTIVWLRVSSLTVQIM
ncbi:carnosine N-methyltransferase unmet-like isoform X2 [Musca autumnalis]|uniref:carnosine N-methyltransferase unmet-like isoform X2 n=1 Tax=Musca autumnalis TaxID=221902 RepID=UPI003CE70856